MVNEKDLIMMYQTEIRNIGLYTSISLATLGYSRYYRGKGFYRNIGGIYLSICFIVMAGLFTYFMYNDMRQYIKKIEKENNEKLLIIGKWVHLLPFIGFFLFTLLIFNLYTLRLEFLNK